MTDPSRAALADELKYTTTITLCVWSKATNDYERRDLTHGEKALITEALRAPLPGRLDRGMLADEMHAFIAAAPYDYPGHNIELFERAEAELRRPLPARFDCGDQVDALAKMIWLAEFEHAFGRVPCVSWENQVDSSKEGHRNTARKIIESGFFAPSPPLNSEAAVSLADPNVIIAGIKQFGLAADGSDLRDLSAAIARLALPRAVEGGVADTKRYSDLTGQFGAELMEFQEALRKINGQAHAGAMFGGQSAYEACLAIEALVAAALSHPNTGDGK